MKQIDVTGDKFDFVDGTEGNIFFDAFSEGEMFKLKVWGVTLLPELGGKDVYIAAMSDLVFEDVEYIHVYYGIYANEQGNGFIKNMEGDNTDMYLELGKKGNLSGCTEYIFGGILGRYAGYGEFKIYCRGKVKLTYDETAFVGVREYCINTEKYSFH